MTIYGDDGVDSAKKSGDLVAARPLAGWLVTAGVGSLLPVQWWLLVGIIYCFMLLLWAMVLTDLSC